MNRGGDAVIEGGGVTEVQRNDREVVLGDVAVEGGEVTGSDDVAAGATSVAAAGQDDVAGTGPALPLAASGQVVLSDGRVFDQQVPAAVGGQWAEDVDEGGRVGPAGGELT